MKDILFIGALDYPNVPRFGDTVKNQHLVEFFKQRYSVDYIDTFLWRKRPFLLIWLLFKVLFGRYKYVIYSVSNRSAYRLTCLFSHFPRNKKYIYFMIGGYTPILIKQGVYKADPFKKLSTIVVEADKVIDFYREVGITNVVRAYNFKPYTYVPDVTKVPSGEIKFVFLSRLTELKGVFLILDAVIKLNNLGYKGRFSVDYYGAIEDSIKQRFEFEIKDVGNASYKGFLDLKLNSNYQVLTNYDAMLFPTMHPTEGFPGVIADAAIAGLPVIASAWNYAEELVKDKRTGYVIPVGDVDALVNQMKFVIENRDENNKLRAHCVEVANEYRMSNILTDDFYNQIGLN